MSSAAQLQARRPADVAVASSSKGASTDQMPSHFIRQLSQTFRDTPMHQLVKDHSGKILYGSVAAGAAFVFLGVGQDLVATMVGTVYPAFMSYKAVKTQEKDDDTQWLIYWIVFATFSLFDQWTSFMLDFIPFYHLVKLAFLLYLMFPPNVRGASWIYHTFIETALDRHERRIENTITGFQHLAGDAFEHGYEQLSSSISHKIKQQYGVAIDPCMLRDAIKENVDPQNFMSPKAVGTPSTAKQRMAAMRQVHTLPRSFSSSRASPATPHVERRASTDDDHTYGKGH